MDIKNLKIDLEKVEGGQWVGDIPEAGDLALHVRGFNCIGYTNALMKKRQNIPRGQRQRDGSLPAEEDYRVVGEAIAETILIDWSGLTSGGEEIKYDKALATTMLTDRAYKPFRDAVMWAALQIGEDQADAEEAVMGNSATSSTGKAPTGTSPTN